MENFGTIAIFSYLIVLAIIEYKKWKHKNK